MNHKRNYTSKMPFKYLWLILLIMAPHYLLVAKERLNGDDLILSQLIEKAKTTNGTISLEANRVYRITKPLNISNSIEGNNSKIIPKINSTVAIDFKGSGIKVNRLEISGDQYKMLDVTGDNITFTNCKFITSQYFVLIRLVGNNTKIINSFLKNNYRNGKSYVVKNKDGIGVDGLLIENSEIYSGVYLANKKNVPIGNYVFRNNKITVDFSHLPQSINLQNDGFHFSGITGITFDNNKIYFKNVTRGFKMTNYDSSNRSKNQVLRPTTNVLIQNNYIESYSKNGKQLFDFYDGTAVVSINSNEIHSYGHTTLFEDKTTGALNTIRKLTLKNNIIYYDFRLVYYRGSTNANNLKNIVGLYIEKNKFHYVSNNIATKIARIGSNKDLELTYPIYARSLSDFSLISNEFFDDNGSGILNDKYVVYSFDINSTQIFKNNIFGGVLYAPNEKSKLIYNDNYVKQIGLKQLITTRKISKNSQEIRGNSISVNNNNLNTTNKGFKILDSSNQKGSNQIILK